MMALLRVVGVVAGSVLATAVGTVILALAFLIANPNFDHHVSHYFWLAMLFGGTQALVFALTYVWLLHRTGQTARLPWAIASMTTVGIALIVPVQLGWPELFAVAMLALLFTFTGSRGRPADDWISGDLLPSLAGYAVTAAIAVGVVVLFLPRQTGFCADHECIPNFSNGNGYTVQCADGEWSHSGGLQGACSHHGGER